MPASISSLVSSDSSQDEDAAPVQLDEGNAPKYVPRRPSILRRLSTTTTSFLLGSSGSIYEGQSVGTVAEEGPNLGLHDDLFGATLIHESLSKPYDDEASISTSSIETPQLYVGPSSVASDEDAEMPPPMRRRTSTVVSTIQKVTKKLGFWDHELHADRIQVLLTLVNNYIFLLVGFMIALCIYWGAYYGRAGRYKDIKFAVMIADPQVGQLPPILGKTVTSFFELPAVAQYGSFDIWNYTRLADVASSHNNTLEQEVFRQVHHQKYKAAFFVHENATLSMYEAMVSLNTTFDPAMDLLSVVFETGSDYNAIYNTITAIVNSLAVTFGSSVRSMQWAQNWMKVLNSTQIETVLTQAPILLTKLPEFQLNDRLPVKEAVVQAPLQIGLIYLCIFTFFQFMFTAPIHMYVATRIKGLKYVLFRFLTAQGAYLQLSLAYVVLNTAFGIAYNKTFGDLGFLVIWASAFLTMSSVGSLIEMLVLICLVVKVEMVGLTLLFVAVTNLAPTISPIYLCPSFYRYGYAMPVYNSYHILQVAFFNSYKGNLGRHYGILVAWIVVTNCCMPFLMKWISKRMAKAKATAKAK